MSAHSAPSPAEWSGPEEAVAAALGAGAAPVPAVRVVHGQPDDVEVAALVAGIVAAQAVTKTGADRAAGGEAGPDAGGAWSDRARLLGAGLGTGGQAWRWSLHP